MTPDDLAAIKARADAATGGRWTAEAHNARPGGGWHLRIGHLSGYAEMAGEDAEFIAHARTDVPDLIAAYEELAAKVATAKAEALREAADGIDALHPDDAPKASATWLRARADRIEADHG